MKSGSNPLGHTGPVTGLLYSLHVNLKSINNVLLVKTMNKLSLIKSMNNLTQMKNISNLALVKTIIEHVMRTRLLRRTIVFLRVRCSIPHCI